MPTVYLGIGSNLGNRRANCRKALDLMAEAGLIIVRRSSFFETAPWGLEKQPAFINMAAEIETDHKPHELLTVLKHIEKTMGRKQTIRWAPRIIDLDILLYDRLVINDPDLTLPHPLLHERTFVLDPLAEIAPSVIHPLLCETISTLREKLRGSPA